MFLKVTLNIHVVVYDMFVTDPSSIKSVYIYSRPYVLYNTKQ